MGREICKSCVYYVKNLPPEMYPEEEWEVLKGMECSIGAQPGDELCDAFKKGSCRLVNLEGGEL
ncbi:hypothetical protein BCF55_1921 [Hydrogenivirga caldilitoris]|uniref:Uncharacterized protein n=1 Tax=Hydrogenivirga caldilitoris TaxID=246264 RepID=A0A497XRN7_9AQUI|nr:hypothetical protein [Hydrogenivirga caldilitoris]RLJ71608.1 hypothetical protein BCF55_1921 [Hydrogenivirga caldilitoris]